MANNWFSKKSLRIRIVRLLHQILFKPKENKTASDFLVALLWLLRILTFAFGLYQILFGARFTGLAIITATAFFVSPAIFTNKLITDFPLEIEVVLFITVLMQYIVGELQGFYNTVPYYDKLVHFFLPLFIAFIGFAITYTLYFSGKLKVSIITMVFITIFMTTGIGAFWEIIEYAHDEVVVPIFHLKEKSQGSLTEDPLHDTMNDLIDDSLGGVVGALISAGYVFNGNRKSARKNQLLKEINKQISRT